LFYFYLLRSLPSGVLHVKIMSPTTCAVRCNVALFTTYVTLDALATTYATTFAMLLQESCIDHQIIAARLTSRH